MVREVDFHQPTAITTVITVAINTTGQTVDASAHVHRCYFPAGTDPIQATATADVALTESYLAGKEWGRRNIIFESTRSALRTKHG